MKRFKGYKLNLFITTQFHLTNYKQFVMLEGRRLNLYSINKNFNLNNELLKIRYLAKNQITITHGNFIFFRFFF